MSVLSVMGVTVRMAKSGSNVPAAAGYMNSALKKSSLVMMAKSNFVHYV